MTPPPATIMGRREERIMAAARSIAPASGTGPDGGRAGEGLETIFLPGVGRGRVYHRLLVAGLVVREAVGVLLERLADAGDVTVAEDTEAASEETSLRSVSLYVLLRQETHQRLGRRQPYCGQEITPVRRPARHDPLDRLEVLIACRSGFPLA